MALTTIPGGLWIPGVYSDNTMPVAFSNPGIINDADDKFAVILRIPKTGTLDKFEWRTDVSAAVAAGSNVRCSFQDVSLVNGDPDGTQDQFRDIGGASIISSSWIAPGLLTSDGTDTGVKRSVTRGDLLACVIEYSTFTAADTFRTAMPSGPTLISRFPYMDQFETAWVKVTNLIPLLALKYNDGTYEHLGPHIYPLSVLNAPAFNNGSTPDERGMIFQFPASVKVGGCWVGIDQDEAVDIVLYDSDGTTPLVTVSLDKDVRAGTAGQIVTHFFSSDVSLLANTNYRLAVKPTTGTNISTYDFDVNAAALLNAVEGGQNWHYTQRTDAGAWTQTTTKRPFMGLLVTAIDDGAGGSGLAHVIGGGF